MEDNYLKQPGGTVLVADAPNWTDDRSVSHLWVGISFRRIRNTAERSLSHTLGQLYGIVVPGLIMTQHLFQGLRRGMHLDQDADAAGKRLAATWAAKRDAVLRGDKSASRVEFMEAPPNRVFVVYISPNQMITDFPDIYGWAEHWTWLAADADLAGAPVDWKARYDLKLWPAPQVGAF